MESNIFFWKGNLKKKSNCDFLINKHKYIALPSPEQFEQERLKEKNEKIELLCISDLKTVDKVSRNMEITTFGSNIKKSITTVVNTSVRYTIGITKCILYVFIHPKLLIRYTYALSNFFIMLSFIYIVGFIIYFFQVDILHKISQKRQIINQTINEAKYNYQINKCDPITRVPALESQCTQWDNTIRNGFTTLSYTTIVVEMIAECIDNFISNMAYKTLITIAILIICYLKWKQ